MTDAAVRPDSRSYPIGRTPRRYTIWCLWGKGCPICSRETTEETMAEITHSCPPEGQYLTPCCGKTPFELPRTDRMTLDPSLVTCQARPEDVPGA